MTDNKEDRQWHNTRSTEFRFRDKKLVVFRPWFVAALIIIVIMIFGMAIYLYNHELPWWLLILLLMYILFNYKVYVLICPECGSPLNSQYLVYTPEYCWHCSANVSNKDDPTDDYLLDVNPAILDEELRLKDDPIDIEQSKRNEDIPPEQ